MTIGQKLQTIYGTLTVKGKRFSPVLNRVIWYGTVGNVQYDITDDILIEEKKESSIEKAMKGVKHIQGEKGEPGYTPKKGTDYYSKDQVERIVRQLVSRGLPVKGKDYYTPSEIASVVQKATPIKGKDYFEAIDGSDGKTPVYGVDYFTKKQIKGFIMLAVDEVRKLVKDGKPGDKGERGKTPAHKWVGTRLMFKKKDGTWGKGVNLAGKNGARGGGGISTIEQARDTTIKNPTNSQGLIYNSTTKKWENGTIAAGGGSGDVVGPTGATDDNIATFDTTTGKLIQDGGKTIAQTLARANHTGTQEASTISDFDTEVANNSAVALNTDKVTNVDTNLSEGTATQTTVVVESSDGTNATLAAASTTRAGLLTKAKWDEIVANSLKSTNATHTGDATGSGALTVVKINGTLMSGLATGILKNTTTTGVPSIAVAGDFPTLNQSTTGSAATLTTPRTIAGVSFDGSANIALNNNAITNGAGYTTNTGDMILASIQSVTGKKTYDTTKLAMKGSSTGVTTLASANASATSYTATLQAATGTVAYTADITGTNSGTNTGDEIKATGAELTTGTDDVKYATAKAIKDSKNVPNVAPGTTGNLLTSDGIDWTSAPAPVSVSVTTKGDLQGYSTAPARIAVGTSGQILTPDSGEATGVKWVNSYEHLIKNETPSGLVNSSNTAYDTANTFIAGKIEVFLNGQLQTLTTDYAETDSNTITFVTAPATGDIVRVSYIKGGVAVGDADTVDGIEGAAIATLTDTQTLTNKTLTAPVLNGALSGDAKATGATITTGTADDEFITPKALADAGINLASVLQIVFGTTSSQVSNSTSTPADTGLTATITPRYSSSKILVLVNQCGCYKSENNVDSRLNLTLRRTSTDINSNDGIFSEGVAKAQRGNQGIIHVDSPATTSATTYKTQFSNSENTASVAVQKDGNSGTSHIILVEIRQ